MLRFALAGAMALGIFLAFVPTAREAAAQTIGQPIRLHSADQRVNVVTAREQGMKFKGGNSIAALPPSTDLPQGGFVVVWESRLPDGSGEGVFARRFTIDGTPVDAADLAINKPREGYQEAPSVVARMDGSFVVTWMSKSLQGSDHGIFVRRFAANGTALDTAEIPVNVHTPGYQAHPAVTARPDGSFVVAWYSDGQDGSGGGIFFRRFAADGTALDALDIQANFNTANDQQYPAIAARPDGSFVVTWVSFQVGVSSDIFARRFAADGTAIDADDIRVSNLSAGLYPTVAARPDGSFLVAWTSYGQDVDSGAIAARRFDADGNPIDATDIRVNVYAANLQNSPVIASRRDGSFVVTWMSFDQDGSSYGIFARRFGANGAALDPADIQINVQFYNNQVNPSIATLPDDETVAIVWSGPGPGDPDGVFMNRLRVGGTPVARPDRATVDQPGSVVINVLANDIDPDIGDTLTVVAVSQPVGGGSVVINGDGTLSYTPPAGCGLASDRFSYTIRDSTGREAKAPVAVTIKQAPLMNVTPATTLRLYGQQGGPFPPPYGSYSVNNIGCADLAWTVGRNATWLGRDPASGTIAPGGSVEVIMSANAAARSLPTGAHSAFARFRNVSNGMGSTNRHVLLTVVDTFGANSLAAARLLSGATGSAWGSNVGATGQSGEPDHAGVSLPLASVWWSWTAPVSGRVIFHTSGSSFDTVLAVYTGTAINALTLVAANDDDPALAPQSRVGFNAVAGTTYRIAVDGKGDATGQIRLNWSVR